MASKSLLSNQPAIIGLSKAKITLLIVVIIVVIIGFVILNNKLSLKVATPNVTQQLVVTKANSSNLSPNEVLNDVKQIKAQNVNKDIVTKTVPPITADTKADLLNELKLQRLRADLQLQQQARTSKSLMYSMKEEIVSGLNPLESFNSSTSKLGDVSSTNTSSTNNPTNITGFHQIMPNQSPYALKAGSVIPATMINGLNSDLAGEVVAYVRANVYDSMTRRYLLIPQGAKLIGVYDSHIIYGQKRVLVAWNRLIYPDGSSINLQAMPGTDIQGYAGFHDQVDNKYWQIFGASFIIGVITGGMQYAQNASNANNINTTPSVQQSVSIGLAQQMGQTGMAITKKNLNLQPTIIIRPNYPFSIMTTADLILKPWRGIN